jgi:prevent-host-death family protein
MTSTKDVRDTQRSVEQATHTIGAFEAKTQFSKLLDRAERGEEIVVTRRGDPIVRIVPFKVAPGSEDAKRAMDELRSRAKRIGISVSPEEIKAWIGEGRA